MKLIELYYKIEGLMKAFPDSASKDIHTEVKKEDSYNECKIHNIIFYDNESKLYIELDKGE